MSHSIVSEPGSLLERVSPVTVPSGVTGVATGSGVGVGVGVDSG